MLVIPFKGWSNRGWCFTSSSQLYSLEATTRPCMRCVGKDGRGGCSGEGSSPVLQVEHTNVFRVCCLALWRKGAGMGNPAGYQEGLLICSVTGTFFPPIFSAVLRKPCLLTALVQRPALCGCEWLPSLLSHQLTQWTQCALSRWTHITNYLFFF